MIVERFTKVERIIQDACYRDIYEEEEEEKRNKLFTNKAQHVPHQENISYLNPRT
jgi:hypothetical protein